MLGRHDSDADVDVGAAHPQTRGAVLRQAPLGDVEARDDLDAGDDGLRQYAGGRGHRPQQPIDPHADDKARQKRLDVDVAGAQLDCLFQEIVDGAHHGRAAGEIAQAFNIVLAQLLKSVCSAAILRLAVDKALIQHRGHIVESCDLDFDLRPEHDFRGAPRRQIGRIGNRERDPAIRGVIGKDQGLAEKARRESCGQRGGRQHILQRRALAFVETGSLIGEFPRRQVGGLPQFRLRDGLQIAPKLALRLVRRSCARNISRVRQLQVPGPTKMLHELQ